MNDATENPIPTIKISVDIHNREKRRGDKGFYLLGNRIRIQNRMTAAFLTTMVAGVFFEVVGGAWGVWLALTVMVTYLIIGARLDKTESEKERFADSNYYLGFIFTLSSLFLTLTPWLGNTVDSGNIIQKFGIAVATTFFGMAIRVVLIQSLADTGDENTEARKKVLEYLDELQTQIAATLEDMKVFQTNIQHATSEASMTLTNEISENRKNTIKALNTASSTLVTSVENAKSNIEDAMSKLVKRISEVEIQPDTITKRIQEINTALAKEIDVAIPKFSAIGEAAGEMKDSMSSLKKAVDKTNTSLAKVSGHAEESTSKTSEAAENVLLLTRSLSQLAVKMDDLSKALDKRAESYKADFDRAVFEVRNSAAEIRKGKDELNQALIDGANMIQDSLK